MRVSTSRQLHERGEPDDADLGVVGEDAHRTARPHQCSVGLGLHEVRGGQAGAAVDAVGAEEEPVDVQALECGDGDRADQGVGRRADPARQHDHVPAPARLVEQLCDGHRVRHDGQVWHVADGAGELEGGRARGDPDGGAGLHETCCGQGDGALLCRHEEGLRGEARLVGGPRDQRQGAAVDPDQEAVGVEPLDVAPYRHVGHAELLDQLGHPDRPRLLDHGQDGGSTLAGEHAHRSLTTAAVRRASRRVGPTSTPETRSWPDAPTSQGSSVWLSTKSQLPSPDLRRTTSTPLGGDGGCRHACLGQHPVEELTQGGIVRQRPEVPGHPITDGTPRDGRVPGQRTAGIRRHGLGVDGAGVLAPLAADAASGERHALPHPEREELLDPDAEQLTERSRVAAEPDVVVGVADAGEVRDQHVRTALGGGPDGIRLGVGDEVEGGHDDHAVGGQVGIRVDDVAGDAAVAQQPVHRVGGRRVVERRRRHARAGHRPGRLVVPEQGDLRVDPGTDELAEPTGDRAQLADLAEPVAVLAGVRHQGRVELLGPGARLPPLEEAEGRRRRGRRGSASRGSCRPAPSPG